MRENLLTPDEVCEWLHITRDSLRHLYRTRRLAFVKVAGRYKFRPCDIEAYINKNRHPELFLLGAVPAGAGDVD
jgi:excisionase family DNA binding protein